MAEKPTYEDLKKRIREFEKKESELNASIDTLKDSEHRYRLLTQHSLTGIYIHIGGTFKFVNNFFAEMLGYKPEQLIGETYWDFVHPKDYAMVRDISLARARGEDVVKQYEFRHITRDGKTVWVRNMPRIIQFDGQTANMGNLVDITEKKQAETSLLELNQSLEKRVEQRTKKLVDEISHRKRAERKYKDLFEFSMETLFLIDLELNIIDCNSASLNLFGFESKQQFLKCDLINLSPDHQPDGVSSIEKIEKMIQLASNKGSHFFEWRHRKLNKQEFDANVLFSKLELEGKLAFQATVRDISVQKKTQRLLIQSEKMMSVGGLAAGMAHEINNPLAGVLQNAELLERRLMDQTMPANIKVAESIGISMGMIHEYTDSRGILPMVEAIRNSGVRIASIVENMLNFARKSDSSFSTHDPIDLMEKVVVIASTDYDLKKKFDFKSILIEKEYDKDLPMMACNGGEIQQVLLNIINNGSHAMFEKQSSKKEYKPKFTLRIRKETERKMLRLEIEDNGTGIDNKTCKRIFEPFFTTKSAGIGTGLGLSVSYFIITENHRGTIEVESELGEWTNFVIRLPLGRIS